MKTCKTCAHRRLTPSKKSTLCLISKWWCKLNRELIGEGHERDLVNSCEKWAASKINLNE